MPPDERRSYQTTFVRLRAYFEPHVMQMDTLSEYWNCKQGKSQSVESYAEELTHLRCLVPTDTESERALVHRFLTNLYDSRVVRDVKMTYPKTLEEAVSKARQSASTFANTGDATLECFLTLHIVTFRTKNCVGTPSVCPYRGVPMSEPETPVWLCLVAIFFL